MVSAWTVVFLVCLLCTPISVIVYLLQERKARRPPARVPRQEELVQVGASDRVAALLAAGRKIDAIIAYRDQSGGVGLTDAKRAVDAWLIRARMRALLASGVSERIAILVAHEQTTEAARAYRAQTGESRREAKASIEAMRVGSWTANHSRGM
jgi:ribosomal protein L7/L12